MLGALSLLWGVWHYFVSNKKPRVSVTFGIPFPAGNRPFVFHICNPGKAQVRMEYIEFEVQQRDSYSISTQIELYKVDKPMLTEGDILKFSVNGQDIVDRLRELINGKKPRFINKVFPKRVRVYAISSVSKKYKATVDKKVENILMEIFDSKRGKLGM
jgi:hypothetical protein